MTGGEGLLHKQACRDWQKYLVGQVSDCAECHIMGIHVGDHLHPSTNVEGKTSLALKHSKIIWLCAQCLKPHKWDLLDNGACEVLQNKKAPGFSVRPDITLVNSEGRPTAFIEFHDSHLSRKAVAVAKEHSIPLFVVDIKRTLDEFQMGLQNPQRGMWQAWAEATGVNPNKSDLWADRYELPGHGKSIRSGSQCRITVRSYTGRARWFGRRGASHCRSVFPATDAVTRPVSVGKLVYFVLRLSKTLVSRIKVRWF